MAAGRPEGAKEGVFAPLRFGVFRNMWIASLFSNFGLFVLGVGAAWDMTQMSGSPSLVALVQSALMLPMALFSLAAGAIADMFDRRKVTLAALGVSCVGAAGLTVLTGTGHLSPATILLFCFIVGSGTALLSPSWGASVNEQVPHHVLPQAIALNGVSWNVARSTGPAIGGVIVAAAGGLAAFATSALFYIPLMLAIFAWKRTNEPSRLPPENLGRAMISGVRYVSNSPAIRTATLRTLVAATAGAGIVSLLPLVSRDLLGGSAQLFGFLLGSFGLGSVIGALNIAHLRSRMSGEQAVSACSAGMALGVAIVAVSPWPALSALALILFGSTWTGCFMMLNVTVQLASPRWVSARALATYQTAVGVGMAGGGWGWGLLATQWGVQNALLASSVMLMLSLSLSRWLRMTASAGLSPLPSEVLSEPDVKIPLISRSGPIVVELEYRVAERRARLFYAVMQKVRLSRMRNGAYGWSIARDIEDPEVWIERYHCPTWHDYLRQRNRPTQGERDLHQRAMKFHIGPEPVRIHRMLERPGGSMPWKVSKSGKDFNEDLPPTITNP
jgi:MFS family permease